MAVERDTLLASLYSLLAQRFGLALAVAAGVALAAGAWMWGQSPDYRVLYANLSDRDGGAIIGSLTQMNIPYKFAESGGALLVPAGQVHEARLRLASQGLPRGNATGFELMEGQKLGTSQFVEQVNYQRALEGELARSIQSLAAVQAARVHLAISRPSVFMREQQKPSASVLLNLQPGRPLDAQQVSAIVHLVSTSVPDLPTKNVTVVDQNGALLSGLAQPGTLALDASQLKYVQELETSYARRIEAILAPITGPGNVRAQVTAEVDFSNVEQAAEIFKPNQAQAEATVRAVQTSEAANGSAGGAGGVPGALSNQPPVPPSAPVVASPAAPAAAAPVATQSSRKDSSVSYEVDKTIRHTRIQAGGIKRLSVAVVVNHRKETDAAGKSSYKPLGAAEIAQMQDLVREAMGYSKERGDSLNVVNSPFVSIERETVPEPPFWKKPETMTLLKETGKHLLIAAVVLYLFLGVLRPLLQKLAEARTAPALLGAEGAEPAPRPAPSYEENLQMARQLARSDPKLVANVVKTWVSGDE